jgi:hypothetical protein
VVLGGRLARFLILRDTPELLTQFGLLPGKLAMSAAKVARCHREHPEVETDIWHDLPGLLGEPAAIIPSIRRDGSIVVALIVQDSAGSQVIVPIAPGISGAPNTVLSVYGKPSGWRWVETQLRYARA